MDVAELAVKEVLEFVFQFSMYRKRLCTPPSVPSATSIARDGCLERDSLAGHHGESIGGWMRPCDPPNCMEK